MNENENKSMTENIIDKITEAVREAALASAVHVAAVNAANAEIAGQADEDGDILLPATNERIGEVITKDEAVCIPDTDDEDDPEEPDEDLHKTSGYEQEMLEMGNVPYSESVEHPNGVPLGPIEESGNRLKEYYEKFLRGTPSADTAEEIDPEEDTELESPSIFDGLTGTVRMDLEIEIYDELYRAASKLKQQLRPMGLECTRKNRKGRDKNALNKMITTSECITDPVERRVNDVEIINTVAKVVTLASVLGMLPNYSDMNNPQYQIYNAGVLEMQNLVNSLRAKADRKAIMKEVRGNV